MRENPIYTITPPDMHLPEAGPVITVLSSDKSFIKDIELLYNDFFKTVPISLYHTNGPIEDSNCAWVVSMMRFSDTIFVDLDNITELGLFCALQGKKKSTVYFNRKNKRKSIVKILNTDHASGVYDSVNDYADAMLNGIETL
jgi:hypothetical protein